MRTKTLALSALLGMLGSASVMAQNVYSVNAVGYINVTIPNGYSILTDPLIATPDNTLNTVLNNAPNINNVSPYSGTSVFQFNNGAGFGLIEVGNPGSFSGGWSGGGADISLNPGSAVFILNVSGANQYATFVGTVPQNTTPTAANFGGMTQTLKPGYNLVGSVVPLSGDLATGIGNLTGVNSGDFIFFFNPNVVGGHQFGYENADVYSFSTWTGNPGPNQINIEPNGDPEALTPVNGFFYYNNGAQESWTESFSAQ